MMMKIEILNNGEIHEESFKDIAQLYLFSPNSGLRKGLSSTSSNKRNSGLELILGISAIVLSIPQSALAIYQFIQELKKKGGNSIIIDVGGGKVEITNEDSVAKIELTLKSEKKQ